VAGSASSHAGGQIVLIDEENGSVVGELGEGFHVVEDSKMKAGSKGTTSSISKCVTLTNIPARSRGDHSSSRWISKYWCSPRLSCLPRNVNAPRLQKLHSRLESSLCVPIDCHNLGLRLENPPNPSR